jgi:hypothetical protein
VFDAVVTIALVHRPAISLAVTNLPAGMAGKRTVAKRVPDGSINGFDSVARYTPTLNEPLAVVP